MSSCSLSPEDAGGYCLSAARAAEECQGKLAPELREGCELAPEETTLAFETLSEPCQFAGDPELADSSPEQTFVAACVPMVVAAGTVTRVRNLGRSQTLSSVDRRELRRIYGDLVDEQNFYFDARLIDQWNLGLGTLQFQFDIAGQTFGDRIYIARPYEPGASTELLVHEMHHAWQANRRGGLLGFATDYCANYYRAGFSYTSHPLEEEARQAAREVF